MTVTVAVHANVQDIRLIRERLDTITIEQSNYAIDEWQTVPKACPKFQDIIYKAAHKTEQSAAVHLCSGRILHDHLHCFVER